MSQKLGLKQSQDLVMTPQLQQAIKLLQLNNVELAEYVDEEMARNPLLEKDDRDDDRSAEAEAESAGEGGDDIRDEFDQAWTGDETGAAGADVGQGHAMADVGAGGNRGFEDVEQSFENRMSRPETLREHLTHQLHMTFDDNRDRMIGGLLIDHLDESGYMRLDVAELAERLNCSKERIERLLSAMKQFDPTGVFAHDLIECLKLQLEEQGKYDQYMKKLLANLDLLASHDHAKLAGLCEVNETYLQDMIADIKALNPKPASEFEHFVVQTAVPDVLMRKLPKNLGGGWRVELNHDTLPKVLINQNYYTEVAQQATQKKDREYLNQQLQNANWLVKALDQRAKTILKVAGEIIEQQEMFFLYGIEYLKPLTLKDIAEEIEMHESTVSRVTANKYIGTPRGLFELKYFFSTALGSGDDAHAAESVKARIKALVDEEDPEDILSDDKIAEYLKEQGIDIARRTVAKYREALHIPSSVQRRKQKRHA